MLTRDIIEQTRVDESRNDAFCAARAYQARPENGVANVCSSNELLRMTPGGFNRFRSPIAFAVLGTYPPLWELAEASAL